MKERNENSLERIWYTTNGRYHRANGPALVWAKDIWAWWLYGKLHRYYGPALDEGNWYSHGDKIK